MTRRWLRWGASRTRVQNRTQWELACLPCLPCGSSPTTQPRSAYVHVWCLCLDFCALNPKPPLQSTRPTFMCVFTSWTHEWSGRAKEKTHAMTGYAYEYTQKSNRCSVSQTNTQDTTPFKDDNNDVDCYSTAIRLRSIRWHNFGRGRSGGRWVGVLIFSMALPVRINSTLFQLVFIVSQIQTHVAHHIPLLKPVRNLLQSPTPQLLTATPKTPTLWPHVCGDMRRGRWRLHDNETTPDEYLYQNVREIEPRNVQRTLGTSGKMDMDMEMKPLCTAREISRESHTPTEKENILTIVFMLLRRRMQSRRG